MREEYRGRIPYFLEEIKNNVIYLCSSNRNINDYYFVLKDRYEGNLIVLESQNNQLDDEKINYELLKILKDDKKYIILMALDTFLKEYFVENNTIVFELLKKINITELQNKLEENGYKKRYLIEESKNYSVRGDIIDIFPTSSDYPIRIELDFDSQIERMAFFDIESQKSIEKLTTFKMYTDNNNSVDFLNFLEKIKRDDKVEFFIENTELLNYKLEEMILRNRDKEEVYRKRFEDFIEVAQEIELKKFSSKELDNYSNYEYIKKLIKNRKKKILIVSEEAKRYEEIFGTVHVDYEKYPLFEGYSNENLLVLTDRELKGIRVKRSKDEKINLRYKSPDEIREGDYIIHENYGVGIYLGIEIIEDMEYLKIKYADEDKLYVPIDNIGRIQRYINNSGDIPEIYKLGRKGFKRKKEKLLEEMLFFAKEIVEIQAKRKTKLGYSFGVDTVWQEEFEESFPFKETPSQLQAIRDVKTDMESKYIMDRVVCGDVGYGKTEVAIRASFKCAIEGKQVAILVPTTVLAQQHYERFCERMKNYPITIELLSRLKVGKEQKEALNRIEQGSSDIIIGTHRLLSEDVKYKDLGLVIVDEEQKFGVKAKEHLKKLKYQVDMLTLTATPIPRTLNLALLGIRDLSIIDTPPAGRKAIKTDFIQFEAKKIKEIVLNEIAREGQVFYIFNSVKGMKKKFEELKKILPEYMEIDYIHGQMLPREIKEKIQRFEDGNIDLLISTTIIENGIDIENANTMIIENSDRLGLSQIYQLRGRVGRGSRQGYCYLITKEYQGKKAQARSESLMKLEEEEGTGLQLSMEDMKIRGAGEILGEKQHGALDIFGYNLYMKMLQEEINKLKNIDWEDEKSDNLEIKVRFEAFIPDDYIEKEEKIRLYRRLVEMKDLTNLSQLRDEIRDIFGKIPKEVEGLFDYISLKIQAKEIGILRAIEKEKSVEIKFINEKLDFDTLFEMIKKGVINYDNMTEIVEYKGTLKEFFQVFYEYRRKIDEGV